MSKDNLVYGLAGMVLGVVIGVLIANFSGAPKQFASPALAVQQAPASTAAAPPQGQLPEGHPPVDDQAMRQQLAALQENYKKDPNNQQTIVMLANLNFDLQNFDEAIKYYDKAIEKDPKNVSLITDLGSAYLRLGQPEKAMQYYNKSLAIQPDHFQTLMNVGIVYMSMGDQKAAAQAWQKLVDLYPDKPETAMIKQAIAKIKAGQQP